MTAQEPTPPPGTDVPDPSGARRTLLRRVRRFWGRHRTLFWMLHSAWALATGIVVIVLARERYGFVPWVVGFLALTWASTLFFSLPSGEGGEDSPDGEPDTPPLRDEVTSYLTRTMYQETLFFLLPFYAYSTVVGSANVAFTLLLGGLAVFSCVDLVFDRLLRSGAVFPLVFFAAVAFAALNLLLPLVLGLDPAVATPLAAVAAVGSALPIVRRGPELSSGRKIRLGGAAVVVLGVALGFPELVPPVPLRMESATFSSDLDRRTLEVADTLGPEATVAALDDGLFVVVEVFAPSAVPTRVSLEWLRDGRPLRTSREVEVIAHEAGFRLWERWWSSDGDIAPGRYEVVLRTGQGRIFGVAGVRVRAGTATVPTPGPG